MGAEVKARIAVDADNALKRIDEINKASNYASASMSKLAKSIGETNRKLKEENSVDVQSFKTLNEQLERQALAYSLVDDKTKAAAQSASLYRNAIISLTKSGSLTKEQTDDLVRTYNEYKTAAESAKAETDSFRTSQEGLGKVSGNTASKLLSVAKNILKFQLLMGPITSVICGIRTTLQESVKVAGEAEQVFSKLATVFDGFSDTANRMASSLASSIGVASSTAASALSTVGDLLQAQGMGTSQSLTTASEWVKQFQDIIAFKDINMTLEEFAQNFMSGAAGNLRNFRTFGSIVKESAVNARLAAEGLDKLTGSELELAKMTTRAEMALEQQANAMGATKREWDTTLSVNRRLNEEWKEFKENLGDTLNGVLKPMKSHWADILSQINKANKAQKEYNEGNRNINVYDIHNNEKDYEAFKTKVGHQLGLSNAAYYNYGDYKELLEARGKIVDGYGDIPALRELDALLVQFNATVSDLLKLTGEQLPTDLYMWLSGLEEERARDNKLKAEREARQTSIETASANYGSFAEALLGITGIKFAASSFGDTYGQWSASESNTNQLLDKIASTMFTDVDSALASIKTSDLAETWGDVISGALDELDQGGLMESRIESVRKLFETTWNQFLPDGFTEKEKAKLEEIKQTYKGYVDELTAYNDELQRQSNFASALGALQDVTLSYDIQIDQIGMTDQQKATDNLRRQYNKAYALAATAEEQGQINDAYEKAKGTLLALYMAQDRYNKQLEAEAAEKEHLAKYTDAVKSIQESTADYAAQMAQIGMTDNDKALDNLARAYEKQKTALELTRDEADTLDKEYAKQRQALIDLQEKQDAYNKMLEAEAYNKQVIAEAQKNLESWQNQALNYSTKAGQVGMSADEITRAGIVAAGIEAEEAADWELYRAIVETLKAFDKLTAEQQKYNTLLKSQEANLKAIEDAQKAIDTHTAGAETYREQLAMLGMSAADQTRYKLGKQSEAALEAGDLDLYSAIVSEILAFNQLQTATEELEAKELEAAKAAERLAAWKAVGNRALGSAGTLGGVIQSFQGEGDIWSKIVNAILAILENTESWPEIAATLDSIFEMFEPVTESLLDLIMTLPWKDIIFMLKVIASAITMISAVIQGINVLVNWLWDNIKIAIKNVATDVYNLFHPNRKRERDQYIAFEVMTDQLAEIASNTQDYLDRIWSANEDIVRNTAKGDDYAKQLALLHDLYSGGALNLSEYSGAVAKVTGSPMGRIESYSGTSYATGSGGVTYYTGDRIFNISLPNFNGDARELWRELKRIDAQESRGGGNLFA